MIRRMNPDKDDFKRLTFLKIKRKKIIAEIPAKYGKADSFRVRAKKEIMRATNR